MQTLIGVALGIVLMSFWFARRCRNAQMFFSLLAVGLFSMLLGAFVKSVVLGDSNFKITATNVEYFKQGSDDDTQQTVSLAAVVSSEPIVGHSDVAMNHITYSVENISLVSNETPEREPPPYIDDT